jgi:hypothetical protein
VRDPVEKVDCAVDGVDDPVQSTRASARVALFADEAVVGSRVGEK